MWVGALIGRSQLACTCRKVGPRTRPGPDFIGAPEGTSFKTKGEIALELIDAGIAAAVPTEAVLADAGYGDQPRFLDGLEARGLSYVVGVASSTRFHLAQAIEGDPPEEPAPPYQGPG